MTGRKRSGGFPRGIELLHDPLLNKSTAFNDAERDALGLRGLLPPRIFSMAEQQRRVMENFARKESDLERYIFLVALQDRNETLFYRTLVDHIEQLLPIERTLIDPKEPALDYLYEPGPEGIFTAVLPRHVEVQVWRALLESTAAEHGARMTAMDSASKNAGEMIGKLTLYMNKVRQAAITKEIIEVVSGAGTAN